MSPKPISPALSVSLLHVARIRNAGAGATPTLPKQKTSSVIRAKMEIKGNISEVLFSNFDSFGKNERHTRTEALDTWPSIS
jgi:hypothetical protein